MKIADVDRERCRRVADVFRSVSIPLADEDEPLVGLSANQLPNLYISVVAICHQTSPLGAPRLEGTTAAGKRLFGWDYLRRRWADRVIENPRWNRPATWTKLQPADVEWLLQDTAGQSTITDAAGRAQLLRDLGQRMTDMGFSDAKDLWEASGWRLVAEEPLGMFGRMAQFRAYRDPVRKKSCFFLELMRGQCGWRYLDSENLGAPVDYHEVRGHLRLGTVVIKSPEVEKRIRACALLTSDEDEAIRCAVYDAIQEIARSHGGTDASTLHYFFWNIFRRCCSRQSPHCRRCGPDCGLPARYRAAVSAVQIDRCVFTGVCASADASRKLVEHLHETDYY